MPIRSVAYIRLSQDGALQLEDGHSEPSIGIPYRKCLGHDMIKANSQTFIHPRDRNLIRLSQAPVDVSSSKRLHSS